MMNGAIIKANEESLNKQSRSFAIPILNLDERFRSPVMVQYNLNKLIDTIEDSIELETDEKVFLLDSFCEALTNGVVSEPLKARMQDVTPKDEIYVIKNYPENIALFKTLTSQEQALATSWTVEMASGMSLYLTKPVVDFNDLNEYCYYVAGSVGIFLSQLLQLKGVGVDSKSEKAHNLHAKHFGLFLQKLNIIRDFMTDNTLRQRSYWPKVLFETYDNDVDRLNALCHETLINDVPHAISYFEEIPQGNDSFDYFIRFILKSGLEYLALLKSNSQVFSKMMVKLPRVFIQSLYKDVSTLPKEAFGQYCREFLAVHIPKDELLTI